MYLKDATNGTNVSKCCSIYFWTHAIDPVVKRIRPTATPLCTSYGTAIGQTSRTLQVDIEIWGLLRLHLFWGFFTRRAKTNCSTRAGRGTYPDGHRSAARLSRACGARWLTSFGLDKGQPRRRIFWPTLRSLVESRITWPFPDPTSCGAARSAAVNTCSGSDNWPARTLLAT